MTNLANPWSPLDDPFAWFASHCLRRGSVPAGVQRRRDCGRDCRKAHQPQGLHQGVQAGRGLPHRHLPGRAAQAGVLSPGPARRDVLRPAVPGQLDLHALLLRRAHGLRAGARPEDRQCVSRVHRPMLTGSPSLRNETKKSALLRVCSAQSAPTRAKSVSHIAQSSCRRACGLPSRVLQYSTSAK